MSVAEVLRGAGIGPVRKGRPLPLEPTGSVALNHGVHLVENHAGGVVFLWGMAAWCWEPGDVAARRLAAVSLVETGAATPSEVAAGFGVSYETFRKWHNAWSCSGAEALAAKKMGPKRASKLTEQVRGELKALAAKGMGLLAISREVGLDPSTVRRGLGGWPPPRPSAPAPQAAAQGELFALAPPLPRTEERALACAGVLLGATPVVTEGASLPFAGALLVLPALTATGVLEAFSEVYEAARAAFYSLRALVLTVLFTALTSRRGRAARQRRTRPTTRRLVPRPVWRGGSAMVGREQVDGPDRWAQALQLAVLGDHVSRLPAGRPVAGRGSGPGGRRGSCHRRRHRPWRQTAARGGTSPHPRHPAGVRGTALGDLRSQRANAQGERGLEGEDVLTNEGTAQPTDVLLPRVIKAGGLWPSLCLPPWVAGSYDRVPVPRARQPHDGDARLSLGP